MRVVVDWDLCQGHGACALEAPEVFALDAGGSLQLLVAEPGEALRAKVEAAVRECPSYALKLES